MSDTDFSYLNTSLWQNRKCIGICLFVAIANMQYGFDSAAVGGLQAMPGFLKVFGYEDAHIPGGYGIDVSSPAFLFVRWVLTHDSQPFRG